MSDEQRARLLRVQLAALVRDLTGAAVEPASIGANAAVVHDGAAYVLSQVADAATLAGALAWTLRQDATSLVLLTDDLGGDVARMAAHFTLPVQVRSIQGAGSVPVEPSPPPEPAPVLSDPELEAQLRDAGLEVVAEDGIVRGEVQGLEVARLVVWPVESGGDGLLHLEAGVGRFDRDAVAAMHQGEPPTTTLARSAEMVRAERVPGRSTHPLSRLARERWLRRTVIDDPSLVGAASLTPTGTTVRRDSVRDVAPAAAVGTAADGSPVVVVCSTGADLSFVPVAADTRAWLAPEAALVLAVPARDRLPTLDRLAALLRRPATVVTVPAPWDEEPVEPGRSA
jgi:hypothetical protein